MNIDEARDFMKNYFERLYKKLSDIAPSIVSSCDLPEEMLAEGADPDEEWNVWKLIPSTVTEKNIEEQEEAFGLKFPNSLKAFLSTYHHAFGASIGRNMPDEPFEALDNAFNPHLAANGYLPFAWDNDGYFIRCIDLNADNDKDRCPVVEFDHERLFDMQYEYEDKGEEIPREQLESLAETVADNLCEYLNGIYDGINVD